MNYRLMGKFLSQILMIEAVFMMPALFISLYYHEKTAALGFFESILLTVLISGLLYATNHKAGKKFYAREGLICVAASWISMSVLGCLPFFFSGVIPNYIDALFEIVSGFTTTGASIMSAVEGVSKGILYWRAFSQWLGGMGVLVFLLAIVSSGGGTGYTMHLMRAESPGPNVGKLVPKIRSTARILYLMYFLLTAMDFMFLVLGGMSIFDALCTSFATAGTGGFGVMNDSIAGFSPYIQNITTLFMFLFGVNFSCYYMLLIGQIKTLFQDEELRLYVGLFLGSATLITINIRSMYPTLEEAIRHAAFQVSSIMTTTGFATTDFDLWPSFSKSILFLLMLVGASAGSTGGGLKCSRVLLLLKGLRRNIRQILNPQKVQVIRINDQVIDEKILKNTNAYLAAYVFIILSSYIVLSLDGNTMMTNLSAVITCFNNVGPGFELVGPTLNFSIYGPISKLVLCLDMLAGRLEIFPILILASNSAWKNR